MLFLPVAQNFQQRFGTLGSSSVTKLTYVTPPRLCFLRLYNSYGPKNYSANKTTEYLKTQRIGIIRIFWGHTVRQLHNFIQRDYITVDWLYPRYFRYPPNFFYMGYLFCDSAPLIPPSIEMIQKRRSRLKLNEPFPTLKLSRIQPPPQVEPHRIPKHPYMLPPVVIEFRYSVRTCTATM